MDDGSIKQSDIIFNQLNSVDDGEDKWNQIMLKIDGGGGKNSKWRLQKLKLKKKRCKSDQIEKWASEMKNNQIR